MVRFEEVQMKIAESVKNHLDIYDMEVLIEQFSLNKEGKFYLTLPDMELPLPITSVVSFQYDVFQTGMSLQEDVEEKNQETDEVLEALEVLEVEVVINFPIMEDYPNIEALLEEISENYPDTEPILIIKEIYPSDEPVKEYQVTYTYEIEPDDVLDSDIFDEIFEELKGVMELIYRRTENYIDLSWYGR